MLLNRIFRVTVPRMADENTPDSDAATELKARRRSSKRTTTTAAREPEPAPPGPAPVDSSPGVPSLPSSSSGISHHSLGGPSSVVGSFTSEGIAYATAGDYVVPEQPGYISYYEKGAYQPVTILAWNAGQQVRKDYYERYGGANAASRAKDAQPINEPGAGLVVKH